MSNVREQIIETYAEWTALSAMRSGAPIKSRRDVYSAIRYAGFDNRFDSAQGAISATEFDQWHDGATRRLIALESRRSLGWAAKIVNVYLKTRC